MPSPGHPAATAQDARLLAGAFLLATGLAVAAAWLLPPPTPPRGTLSLDAPRDPERSLDEAVAAADRRAAARPNDVPGLMAAAAQLRASHRPLQLATVLERLHALTGDAAALREAMALRLELGDFIAARMALERLVAMGVATPQEATQLAEAKLEANDIPGAFRILLRTLQQEPTEAQALHVLQTAMRLPDPAPAMGALSAALAGSAPLFLEPMRRILMDHARPDLAMALMEGLPPEELASPATIFRLAEAEARAGFVGSALARLLALRVSEGLPPGAGALLVDLALREGRLEEAFEVAALLPDESWPPILPVRLLAAARGAQRPELFLRLDPQRLAARPEIAALLALARGERPAALRFARAALDRPPPTGDGARGLAAVLRELGQDGPAWDRLRAEVQRPGAEPAAIRLFAELAALPGRAAAALPLLERLREGAPLAAEAWLRLALQEDRREEVAAFLRSGGAVPPEALAETLTMAAMQQDAALADAAADALRRRHDLPEGWTPEEVTLTASLARPLTPSSLAAAVDLLGWSGEAAARQRVARLLANAPDLVPLAVTGELARHPAVARLRREAEADTSEGGLPRLAVLAMLAPGEALPLLTRRAEAEPGRFAAALAIARMRAEGPAAAEAALRPLLPRLPRALQEATLYLVLSGAPAEAQPGLRALAEGTLGANWQAGYEAYLARQRRQVGNGNSAP